MRTHVRINHIFQQLKLFFSLLIHTLYLLFKRTTIMNQQKMSKSKKPVKKIKSKKQKARPKQRPIPPFIDNGVTRQISLKLCPKEHAILKDYTSGIGLTHQAFLHKIFTNVMKEAGYELDLV